MITIYPAIKLFLEQGTEFGSAEEPVVAESTNFTKFVRDIFLGFVPVFDGRWNFDADLFKETIDFLTVSIPHDVSDRNGLCFGLRHISSLFRLYSIDGNNLPSIVSIIKFNTLTFICQAIKQNFLLISIPNWKDCSFSPRAKLKKLSSHSEFV